MSSRNYIFVLNNYTEQEESDIKIFIETWCKYGIFGHEIGKQGTPHLQGFIILKTPWSFKTLKNKINKKCHLEKCLGNAISNFDYATK